MRRCKTSGWRVERGASISGKTEYLQILEGSDAVLEWVKGKVLRPILNDLEDRGRETFLSEYARRLRTMYPVRADGRTLYPLLRLFIVATV